MAQNIVVSPEISFPDSITEYHDLWQVDLLIRWQEVTSQQRSNAEALKEIGRSDIGQNLFWFVTRKIGRRCHISHRRDTFKHPIVRAIVAKVRRRNPSLIRQAYEPPVEPYQAVREGKGQRTQDDRLDHAEDRSVRRNAQSQ